MTPIAGKLSDIYAEKKILLAFYKQLPQTDSSK
jgi:hypothetical protein